MDGKSARFMTLYQKQSKITVQNNLFTMLLQSIGTNYVVNYIRQMGDALMRDVCLPFAFESVETIEHLHTQKILGVVVWTGS